MAGNPTKWKLNKAEQKQLDDEAKAMYEEKIAEGMSKPDAQKEKAAFIERRSREMKGDKAAKSAAKKAEQKRKAGPGASKDDDDGKASKDVTMAPDFNSDYYTAVMEAKKVILDNPMFSRIEAEEPIPIKEGGDSGVQAGN